MPNKVEVINAVFNGLSRLINACKFKSRCCCNSECTTLNEE